MRRVLFVFILLFCSGLARAGTPPEDICQKLSTGHAGRESQPPYRLRCERAEDGSERVQLLIDGKKPLMLAGVGGEPLASQEVIFDPVSVTVRLLEGQPNLYWIRYGHTSLGAGGVDVDNQRHWVVQKGDTGRTVFDKWTKVYENNRGGNFSSTSEDVAIEYRGSTLRVINTRFRGEAVEDDLHEPGEPGYRESGSTESLVKATREIGASTGRMILEKTIWAKANGDYLLLDDGVAGWLLVTNPDFRLASWQPGEMLPRNRIPDLGKLEEIPAVAACWLYNRIPWTPANLPRTRPPAPPEQVRPGHFVPENCCNLETSADGKQVFFYETVDVDEYGNGKSGRLLAMFDVVSKTCYGAQLATDGHWGKSLPFKQVGPSDAFDQLGNPLFSPDGSKLGFRAKQGDHWFIVLNDQRGPEFDLVSSPVFSPDGRHVAYWAKQAKKELIVLDNQEGPAFDGAGMPIFSPDGSKAAYRARDGKQWFVVLGEQKSPAFDDIGYYTASESGRANNLIDVVFNPDGRQLAYAARRGNHWFIVRNGQPGPVFEHVGLPVFGPDGRRLAFRARQGDREFIVLDGRRGPNFDFVGNPIFSPDGREVAYWARQGEREFVMHGERKGPVFDRVGAPVFNRDNGQVVYWAKQGEQEFVLSGENKGPVLEPAKPPVPNSDKKDPIFDEVGEPVLSPDGSRLAYRARRQDRWFMMIDALGSPKTSPASQAVPASNLSLTKAVPTVIPHPIVVRESTLPSRVIVIGGSTKGGWIVIDETRLPDSGTPEGKCKPLGYELIPGGLTYKFYSFDKPLGECPGFVSLCVSDDYDPPLKADFPVCPAKERFSIGIAGSWNALPRTPKALENHQEFAPIIRKLLDANGLKQAPVRIEYVHSIDLDGDGTEERFINARSSKDCSEISTAANHYAVFVLLRTARGKPETTVLSESWGESRCLMYETYNSSYADLNGDGIMEILQFGGSEEGDGLQVKAFQAGKPVPVPLGYRYHW